MAGAPIIIILHTETGVKYKYDVQVLSGGIRLFRENVAYFKLRRCNQKYLLSKMNGYGENGKMRFKE